MISSSRWLKRLTWRLLWMCSFKKNRLKGTLFSSVCRKIIANTSSQKSNGMKVFIIEKKQRLVAFEISAKMINDHWWLFQNIGWQLETMFHKKNFTNFPQIFVTFITVHEAPQDRIFDQSSSSSRNPENNLDFQNYDPENCFVTDKSLFLHQDAPTKTAHVVFQDTYKLASKEEFNKKRFFAWFLYKIFNLVSVLCYTIQIKRHATWLMMFLMQKCNFSSLILCLKFLFRFIVQYLVEQLKSAIDSPLYNSETCLCACKIESSHWNHSRNKLKVD